MMNGQRYVLGLLLSLFAGSNSQFGPVCSDPNQNLVNTVVYEGTSSSFSNKIDPNNVTWNIAPSYDPYSSPLYLLADDNSVEPEFTLAYAVTQTQLSIDMVSAHDDQPPNPFSTSGVYVLSYKTDGCQSMANLIAVAQAPVCQCNATDSDNAVLSCELNYGAARILPNRAKMSWSTDCGQVHSETPIPNQENPNYEVSTSYHSITSLGATTYTCGVTFTAPDPGVYDNMATNAPTFYASCTIANCVKPTAISLACN